MLLLRPSSRWPDANPHAERFRSLKIPRNFPRTIPTPPDRSDATGQDFCESRMIPTPPDESDHPYPSFNPKVPGSRPGRPTEGYGSTFACEIKSLSPGEENQIRL
jgi:hypothetical protein